MRVTQSVAKEYNDSAEVVEEKEPDSRSEYRHQVQTASISGFY